MQQIKPCPECGQKVGITPIGPYRVQCMGCGALLKNNEVTDNKTTRR